MGMKTENSPAGEAVSAFLELLVDELLKAIGCQKRIRWRTPATDGFADGIVDIDDADGFHWIQISSGCLNRKL